MGLHFTACAPKKYQPDPALVAQCEAIAAETGATLRFEEDPAVAAKGADVLYTDVWVSMGEPVEVWAERINDLAAYQINQELMKIAGPKPCSCTACPLTTTTRPPWARRWASVWPRRMEVTERSLRSPEHRL